MTQHITLTIEQARELQRANVEGHGQWQFLLAVPLPLEPNSSYDADRLDGGVKMLEMGCSVEQVADHMKWKDAVAAGKQLHRAQVRKAKLEKELEKMFAARYGPDAVH